MTKLNPLDRLLFLYLLTNEHTNISGIYEISEHKIAFDTGLERDTLVKAMIPRLEPKVYFKDNWIILINFTKHQNLRSDDVVKGIKREFDLAPITVQEYALSRGWGDGLGMVPGTKPNLTKPNLQGEVELRVEKITSEEEKPLKEKKDTAYRSVFEAFGEDYPFNWRTNRTEIEAAKNLLKESNLKDIGVALSFAEKHKDSPYCPAILKPSDLDRKWDNLLAFKKKHG